MPSFKLAWIILTLTYLQIRSSSAQTKLSQCQLSWKPYIAGEEFPPDAVQLDGPLFVARMTHLFGFIFGRKYAAGTANNDTKEASFVHPLAWGKVTLKSFDLLVNPNDCAIGWMDAFGEIEEPEFALHLESNRYVAMRKSGGKIVAGTLVTGDINFFHAVDPETDQAKTDFLACEALKSTENLRLTVKNLKFVDKLEEEIPDFMGTDLIENQSPAVLEHIVSHEKTVIIRHEISESRSFAQSTVTTFSIGVSLGPLEINAEWQNRHDIASGRMSNIVNEKEETVKSSRTIIVPPLTSVHACSVLFSAKSLDMPYTGEGVYGIKGRSSTYVEGILRAEGYDVSEIRGRNGTHIFVNISGNFSIESPMRTKLVVFAKDSPNIPEGCDTIQKSINELNKMRRSGRASKEEIDTLKRKVKELLHE